MLKHNKKIKFVKKAFILFFCFLFTIVFVGCKKQTKQAETPTTHATENQTTQPIIENNGNGQLHSFIIPKSIMGKYSAEEIVADFNDSTTVASVTGDIPIKEAYTDIYANDDGTVTYVFTDKQLEMEKMYFHQTISHGIKSYENSAVKNVEFTDNFTEIVFYVSGYDEYKISDAIASMVGNYQILNGVAPDKWHVKVTVKDYETGKVISEDSYPKE